MYIYCSSQEAQRPCGTALAKDHPSDIVLRLEMEKENGIRFKKRNPGFRISRQIPHIGIGYQSMVSTGLIPSINHFYLLIRFGSKASGLSRLPVGGLPLKHSHPARKFPRNSTRDMACLDWPGSKRIPMKQCGTRHMLRHFSESQKSWRPGSRVGP